MLTEPVFDELVEAAHGDFDQLVKSTREAMRPVLDGDWAWKLPSGRRVRIDDLAIEVVERIALKHNISWMTMMRSPAASGTMAWDVYVECCRLVGEEPMDRPKTAGEFLEFTALVDLIDKDRSTTFGEDGVPLEGDPPTP
jgi:hypothetical protein